MVRNCKVALAFGVALALALGTSSSADAAFKLRITDGFVTRIVTDGVALDSAGGAGDLTLLVAGNITYVNTTSFAGFAVTVATGTSQPLPPNSAYVAFEDVMLTITYLGAGPATMTIDLTDTSFSLLGAPVSSMTSSAKNNSSAGITETFQSYVNYGAGGNNEWGGIDATGGTVFTTGLQSADSIVTKSVTPALSNPFSMSSRTVISFAGAGTASIDNNTTVATPAPAGILLALSGTPFLYWIRRRQARRATAA